MVKVFFFFLVECKEVGVKGGDAYGAFTSLEFDLLG